MEEPPRPGFEPMISLLQVQCAIAEIEPSLPLESKFILY